MNRLTYRMTENDFETAWALLMANLLHAEALLGITNLALARDEFHAWWVYGAMPCMNPTKGSRLVVRPASGKDGIWVEATDSRMDEGSNVDLMSADVFATVMNQGIQCMLDERMKSRSCARCGQPLNTTDPNAIASCLTETEEERLLDQHERIDPHFAHAVCAKVTTTKRYVRHWKHHAWTTLSDLSPWALTDC